MKTSPQTTIKGSTVLVTGGTGSFGRQVASHLFGQDPKELRIYSRDEKKQWEMQLRFPNYRYFIGDVRDYDRLAEAMDGVDYVFHAAALKHVPACEQYPFEAVKTNILGTANACAAAREKRVKRFIALSTDKAVKPVNAMGTSKAMMEKIVCTQNQYPGETIFSCVRYGNVLGSRGSVVPLFLSQIERGEPLTVTVPDMTRFLMTLSDSVDLVVKALQVAQGGEIFVRKAPACTVQKLAETLRLKHSPQGAKHPIKILGPRPGEKVDEVLVSEYEMMRVSEDDTHFTIHPSYRIPSNRAKKDFGLEYTSANTRRLESTDEIASFLARMGDLEELL